MNNIKFIFSVLLLFISVVASQPSVQESVQESEIVFCVLYTLTLIGIAIVFYFERKIIKPVILAHSAREDHSDFSALPAFSGHFDIRERIKIAVPPTETILWQDVSLSIAQKKLFAIALANIGFGYLLIVISAHKDYELDLTPILLLVLFGGFLYIGKGLKQVIGVVVVNYSHLNCRKPETDYIAYYDISDLQLILDNDQVGSVSFKKRPTNEKSFLSHFKSIDPAYCVLRNIVNPREVFNLLQNRITGHQRVNDIDQNAGGYQDL